MAECVRLESGYTARYRGFDSLPLRISKNIYLLVCIFDIWIEGGRAREGSETVIRQPADVAEKGFAYW